MRANIYTTIVLIDDNSPDDTATVAQELQKELKTKRFIIQVLSNMQKSGLGQAYVRGFQYALQQDYDAIMQMDADLSHNPSYLPIMLTAFNQADMVIASRYIPGGATPNWKLLRRLASRGGNWYARLFLGDRLTDYTGGFNLYAATLLRKLDITTIQASGYTFQVELKQRALQQCKEVCEIPIVFTERKYGRSKIPRSTIAHTLVLIPKLWLQTLFQGYKITTSE